ncbi:MAG: preprotein translocase subunit SecG [Candidatus Omnitrophica bacterium]|jgi:preprotein translocase subunit SecG|nr:preprotein translocase subunit SecG [Candidatus Omnitrophota bacterium]
MYILVLVVHIIVSFVLVGVILLQTGKGGGLAETFGGGGSSQMTIFGQKAGAFLTKATEVSAILFLCTSLALAFLSGRRQKSIMDSVKTIPVTASDTLDSSGQKTDIDKNARIEPQTGNQPDASK